MGRKNAVAAFLPTLDFTSAHGLQRSYPKTDPNEPWASSFSFTLAETLYDNGESITKHRIASIQEELSRLQLERERDRLLLAVASAFFQRMQAQKNLETQQEQNGILKKQVELVRDSYRQGVKTRKDYLRFQTQLNRADIDLLRAKDGVLKADQELKKILGVPLDSDERLEFAMDDKRAGRIAPASFVPEKHRDYKVAELQRRVSGLNTQLASRKLWPEVGLALNGTYGSSGYVGPGKSVRSVYERDSSSWSAFLTLKYNIFDFGLRRRNAEIAAETAAVQSNDLESQLLDLRSEVSQLQSDLRQLQESFRISEELLKLEQGNLALISSEYRQGKVQYLDYITSLQNVASARSSYYSALYELRKGELSQKYHEGKIYEAILGK